MPLVAVARELAQRGHEIQILGERHLAVLARDTGIPFHTIPGPGAPFADLGEGELRRLVSMLAPQERIIVNPLAPAAVIAARYLGLPWVYAAASPLAFPVPWDPPWWPVLAPWQRRMDGLPGISGAARHLARFWADRKSRFLRHRAQKMGVRLGGHPRFEGLYSPTLNLLLATPELLSAPPPACAVPFAVTGFCDYIPASLHNSEAQARLEHFLGDGPAPVVIAPGGADRSNPREFVDLALKACQVLELRAVVSIRWSFRSMVPESRQVLVLPYLPYPMLFQRCAAVIHSGGVGTLSWAVRAGVPSVLLPSVWDQFDNTRRALERGWGVWPRRTAPSIARSLELLLQRPGNDLVEVSTRLRAERGASTAADRIESEVA